MPSTDILGITLTGDRRPDLADFKFLPNRMYAACLDFSETAPKERRPSHNGRKKLAELP